MLKLLVAVLAVMPTAGAAQAVQAGGWAGSWDVTSRVVDLTVPGLPGFLARGLRGKSKVEHRRLAAGDGVEALLAPDPKARCRIDNQRIADGRYTQTLLCPQKRGEPLRIARTGGYGPAGFVGRASLSATTPKGPIAIVLDQRAVRVGD